MSRPALDSKSTSLSGADWTARYPGSSSLTDLRFPFRGYVEAFTAALRSAKVRVTIAATFRPKQRAYLMHWSWRIANMKADAQRIPPAWCGYSMGSYRHQWALFECCVDCCR